MASDNPPENDATKEIVEGLGQDGRTKLRVAVAPVLDAQRVRIEYAESRRAALGVLGGVLLAAGLAALIGLATGDVSYEPAEVGLIALAVALIVTGAAVVVIYALQTNWDYPFKAATSTWKWFYRYAIPTASAVEPRWHAVQSSATKTESRRIFSEGHRPFIEGLTRLQDDTTDLAQDLEQVYVLHWNEFYKNAFLTSLRSVLSWGVIASLAVGAVAFLIGLIYA